MKQPTENSKKYPYLEQLSTQELEDLLQKDFVTSEDDPDSTELILAIMEVIHAREVQQTPPIDEDTAWNTFLARNIHGNAAPDPQSQKAPPATPEKTARRRPLHRWMPVAAVVCVLVCLSLVPVQGKSPLRTFVDWTASTFSFLPQEGTGEESANLPSLADPDFSSREAFADDEAYSEAVYPQVQAAVADLTDRPVLPTWHPDPGGGESHG